MVLLPPLTLLLPPAPPPPLRVHAPRASRRPGNQWPAPTLALVHLHLPRCSLCRRARPPQWANTVDGNPSASATATATATAPAPAPATATALAQCTLRRRHRPPPSRLRALQQPSCAVRRRPTPSQTLAGKRPRRQRPASTAKRQQRPLPAPNCRRRRRWHLLALNPTTASRNGRQQGTASAGEAAELPTLSPLPQLRPPFQRSLPALPVPPRAPAPRTPWCRPCTAPSCLQRCLRTPLHSPTPGRNPSSRRRRRRHHQSKRLPAHRLTQPASRAGRRNCRHPPRCRRRRDSGPRHLHGILCRRHLSQNPPLRPRLVQAPRRRLCRPTHRPAQYRQ